MNANNLNPDYDAFPNRIESHAQFGTWSVRFATNDQIWSPGLFQLLGLSAVTVRPSYTLFLSMIHPDDRQGLDLDALVQGGAGPVPRIVRLVLPDGRVRSLSLRIEVHIGIDGRPIAVRGVALDVSDREKLARLRALERQQREALYLAKRVATYSVPPDRIIDFPRAMSEVHGLEYEEICFDPFMMVLAEERERFRDYSRQAESRRVHFQGTTRERLADGEIWQFRIVGVPLFGPDGAYLGAAGLKHALHLPETGQADDRLRHALEQAVCGHHLRAARALPDWSMTALAEASGLSLSTVRRLEEDGAPQSDRSRGRAIEALRAGGVRFISMDDGTIAVARS